MLFTYFHWAVNEALRIGDEKNLTSMGSMFRELYYYIQNGFLATHATEAYKMALEMLKAVRTADKKLHPSK